MITGPSNLPAIDVLRAARRGHRSVLVTGPTGSGKTFLSHHFGRDARIFDEENFADAAENIRAGKRVIVIAADIPTVRKQGDRVTTVLVGQTLHATLERWTPGMASRYLKQIAPHLPKHWVSRVVRNVHNPRMLQGFALNTEGKDDEGIRAVFCRFAPTVAHGPKLRRSRLLRLAEIACEQAGVKLEAVLADSRTRWAVRDRHTIWWVTSRVAGRHTTTLCDLGELFKRDHSSIIHGLRRVEQRVNEDQGFRTLARNLESEVAARWARDTEGDE